MRKVVFFLLFLLMSLFIFSFEECTTAIVGDDATKDGSQILWKNRDTSHRINRVIFKKDYPFSYLAIVNNNEKSGRIVYGGINSCSFAIINSVAVNLPQKCGEQKDLEGMIMADALRCCKSVDDFENYLRENIGESLGAQSNFGVIDSFGGASLFEVYNHGYKRFDAKNFRGDLIVNTNFSRSGKKFKGAGYLRFYEAEKLLKKVDKISVDYLLKNVVGDIKNYLIPLPDINKNGDIWIDTVDSIDRNSTASSMIFKVFTSKKLRKYSTMWVILGEPITSIAVPLWVETKSVPYELNGGKIPPIVEISNKIKGVLRPLKGGHRPNYLNYSIYKRLKIKKKFWEKEKEIIIKTKDFLKGKPDSEELLKFQNSVSKEVYEFMKNFYDTEVKQLVKKY